MNVKFSALIVVLGVLSTSAFVCPKFNVANDFHPHETDNTRYYNCTRGVATEETCGGNLIFSKLTYKCTTVWTNTSPIDTADGSTDSTAPPDLLNLED